MKHELLNQIKEEKLIVIIRGVKEEQMLPLLHAMYDGGIRLAELTFDPLNETPNTLTADLVRGAGGTLQEATAERSQPFSRGNGHKDGFDKGNEGENMTAKEMEVAYCKARITCIKSFRLLLREHVKLSEEGLKLKLTYEQVHKLMIAGLKKVDSELTAELEKWSKMISEAENDMEMSGIETDDSKG